MLFLNLQGYFSSFLSLFSSSLEDLFFDTLTNEGLNNLSKETRDEVIAGIKSQSTHIQPWSELKTKLTEAVYFLGQRNLIEFVSVMNGTLKK